MKLKLLFLSAQGRIARSTWWVGIGGLILCDLLAFLVLWSVLGPSLVLNFFGRLVWFCVIAANIYASYCLSAKRFQDRNRSALNAKLVAGIWAAKALLDLFRITGSATVPTALDEFFVLAGTAIALWYFIELGWMEGSAGRNDYGDPPAEIVPPRRT